MAERSELETKLAAIKAAYIAELPVRAASLRAAWREVQEANWAQPPLQELYRLAHSLAGSGATFGFTQLSAQARALEIPLQALLQNPAADRDAVPALFDALLKKLLVAAEGGV